MTFGSRAAIDQVVLKTILTRVNRFQNLEKQVGVPADSTLIQILFGPCSQRSPYPPPVVRYTGTHRLTPHTSEDPGESIGAEMVPKLNWEWEGGSKEPPGTGGVRCTCVSYSQL